MAFTVEDFEDLQRLLAEHPEWRAQLRPLILGDEFLQVPARLNAIDERLERITALLAEMAERQNRMEGRMGNFDGKFLELTYDRQLRSWFGRYVKGAEKLAVEDLDQLESAVSSGSVDSTEVDRLHDLDFIVRGRRLGTGADILYAVEVSTTVRVDDVERAQRRAVTLKRAGYPASGFVGGITIDDGAKSRAEELGVVVDLHPSFVA